MFFLPARHTSCSASASVRNNHGEHVLELREQVLPLIPCMTANEVLAKMPGDRRRPSREAADVACDWVSGCAYLHRIHVG
eukprot:751042-Hanusia_phi.AAC.1